MFGIPQLCNKKIAYSSKCDGSSQAKCGSHESCTICGTASAGGCNFCRNKNKSSSYKESSYYSWC